MPETFAPLPQHRSLVDWLQQEEKEVWDWFADKEKAAADAEQVRLSLLRDTYRMDAGAHPEIFREIEAACTALDLKAAVHVYQAQNQTEPNAAVCCLPGEAHVIFSGPILSLLSADELRAVIGHELAHHLLWRMEDGAFLLADRILHSAASHPGAEPAHAHSARVWRLATELFADRGAFLATGSLEAAVGGLVKTTTGLAQVSAKSYLAQAEEIFSKSKPKTEQFSHPETFIRARALQLWVEEDDTLEETISRMLDSDDSLDTLTLPQQSGLAALTRRFLAHLLEPAWFQTEAVMAHARQFFREFKPQADVTIVSELADLPTPQREYFAQVMLDFCAVDPDLHDPPLSRCLEIARELECLGSFEKMLAKELKVKAKDLKKLKEALP
ncbi:M48 family metalloprotease [Prosthecobacter sp.]|uniref:M48 family metalloprotease n=1 Tax=Prosthecobacter sp. TaxID=1965333 RepID=UPI003783BAAA